MADNKTSIILTAEDRTAAAIASTKKALGGLAGAAGSVDSAFAKLTGIGSILGGIGAGLSVAGVATFIKGVADSGDAMNDLSQRTGFAVESLSKYQYAAKLSDLTNEQLESSLGKLNKSIGSNSDAFGKIGINLKDSQGKLKGNAVVLEEVADKFSKMEDGAQKAAIAQELFGKSGAQMIPFLNQGKEGLAAMGKEAERLGLVMSSDLAAKSARLNDSLDTMGAMFNAVRINVGGALIPMLAGLAEQMLANGGAADEMSAGIRNATQQDTVRTWAQSAASAAAFVVDGFKGVSAAVQGVSITLAAGVAQTAALLSGNLGGVQAIGAQWQVDMAKLFSFDSAQVGVDTFFANFDKTVTISGQKFVLESAEQAKTVQAIYDKYFADQAAAQKNVTAITDEQLKLRTKLTTDYAEQQKRAALGETDYAIAKIREKYKAQLDALKGVENEAAIRAEYEKRQQAEIDAVYIGSVTRRAEAEKIVTDSVTTESGKRVSVERTAAENVIAVWNQANAVKAAATGGAIMNQGTPGEFVSSWDASGKYVGDLGRTTSGAGALGNAWSSDGRRKLSIAEELSMLNGFGHYAAGGSFMVGGKGGTDTTPVGFMATPGERVTIQTPEQQRSSGGVTIHINGATLSASQIIAAIKQGLRTDPGLLTPGFARPG